MSLQFTHVRSFACRGRLHSYERIVLSSVFIAQQQRGTKSSKVHVTVVCVLPHLTVEHRHLWQKMQRDCYTSFSLRFRKGKAFCERAFALHRQQPEKDKQNVSVAPLEKFLRTPLHNAADLSKGLLLSWAADTGVNQPATNLKPRISANTKVISKKLNFAPEDSLCANVCYKRNYLT